MSINFSILLTPSFVINSINADPIIAPLENIIALLYVLELLIRSGRSLPHSLMMMLPEAWAKQPNIDNFKKDFYEFHSSLMEPWDGPSLIVGTDGDFVCAISDRNGLRPCRYFVTKNNLLVMGSETGILNVNEDEILYKSRIE